MERCTGTSCSDYSEIASGITTLYYSDSGLTGSTVYRYRVRATNATGDGSYSGGAEETTLPPTTLTIGTEGTQVATLAIGATSSFLGGAFTLSTDTGSAFVSSIILTETGTVDATNLSNVTLYSKEEATCSTTLPIDASLFGATTTFSGANEAFISNAGMWSDDGVEIYDHGIDAYSGATSIIQDASGNLYVGGYVSVSGEGTNMAVRKYDANGDLVSNWGDGDSGMVTYNGVANGGDLAYSITLDASGNLYVGGSIEVSGQGNNMAVRKYDANGDLVSNWGDGDSGMVTYNLALSNGSDVATSITVDDSGNLYMGGYMTVIGNGTDMVVRKYDTNGDLTSDWGYSNSGLVSYNGVADGNDYANSITLDASGNLYVGGNTSVSGQGLNMAVRKYDANGDPVSNWGDGDSGMVTYNGALNLADFAKSITLDASGNLYVGGEGYILSSEYTNLYIFKYDTNGDLITSFGNDGISTISGFNGGDIYSSQIILDTNNNLYLAGEDATTDWSYADWLIVSLTEDGQLRDSANALAVDTAQVCLYVVLDVEEGASINDTIEIEISDASTEVTADANFIEPDTPVAIADTTTLVGDNPPTVTTNAATNVSSSSIQFNGEITDTGGENASIRGFAYSTTSANLSSSTATTTNSGSFGVGTFNQTLSSLLPNTRYYFRAYAENSAGTSTGSILSTTTKPGLPGTPTFADVTQTTLTLNWTAPSGSADSYKIERCAGAACSDWTQIASGVGAVTYDDSSLSANTIYRYRVRATGASGDGNYSVIAQQLTLPATPGTPTFSDITNSSLTVNWTAPSGGATSYIIERCTGAACSDFSNLSSGVNDIFYNDSGLTPETHYRYRITATNATGNGSVSGVAGTSTVETTFLPSVDTDAASSITGTSSTLNGDITDTGNLTVTRRGFAYSTVSGLTSSVSTTSNTGSFGTGTFNESIGSLTPGLTYYFRAYAENSNGTSTGSILSFSTPAAPSVTTNNATLVTNTTMTLNADITATGGANITTRGFAYSTVSGLASDVSTTTENGSFGTGIFSTGLSSLSPNTDYYFRAYAINLGGTTNGSILSTTTKPSTPGTPTFDNISTTTLTVNWTAPSGGADSYKLERCSGSGCSNWTEIDSGIEALTYADTLLTANTLYRYRLRATGASGDGDYSGIDQTYTAVDPDAADPIIRVEGGVRFQSGRLY